MARYLFRAGFAGVVLAVLTGCMTTSMTPDAADGPDYLVKSASVSGVAPASVSGPVEQELSASLRGQAAPAGAVPVQVDVTVTAYNGARVGSGYRASADVTVALRPSSGGKVLQAATFHEDAAAPDQKRAEAQLAHEIALRVQRNANLPIARDAVPVAGAHAHPDTSSRKVGQAADDGGALSVEALEALMRASSGSDAGPDGTKTGSVPQTVEVPDAACSGKSLSSCPPSALLSGDFSLRK